VTVKDVAVVYCNRWVLQSNFVPLCYWGW